tara:strand:+ start:312 stop:1205 length:894 start_codon:yes stop_codon:yes gene_type:complete
MNHGEMSDIILMSDLHCTQKMVLLGYLKHRNKASGLSWPGATTLAKYASTSRRGIIRHRKVLIESGWLNVVSASPGKPLVVTLCHPTRDTQTPPPVTRCHPNLLHKPSLITLLKNTPTNQAPAEEPEPGENAMPSSDTWDKFNAIRKQYDPKYRDPWGWKRWGKHWKRCNRYGTQQEVLDAFKYFWTSPDTKWWRDNHKSPSQGFLNGATKHMAGWVQAAADQKGQVAVADGRARDDRREDTGSHGLARMWIRHNRPGLELAMRGTDLSGWLKDQVTDVDAVLNLLGRGTAQGVKHG